MSFGAPTHHDKPQPYTLCHCRHETQRMMQPYFTAGSEFTAARDNNTNCYGRNGVVLSSSDYVMRFEDEEDAEKLARTILEHLGFSAVDLDVLRVQRNMQQKADAGARRAP